MAKRKPTATTESPPRPRKRTSTRRKNGNGAAKPRAAHAKKANGSKPPAVEDDDELDDETRAILAELEADSDELAAVDAVTRTALGQTIKNGQRAARTAIGGHDPGAVAAALVLALPEDWRDDDQTYALLEKLSDGEAAIVLSWLSGSWSLGYACRVNDEREGNDPIVTPEDLARSGMLKVA